MNRVKIKFENCYGIKKLFSELDFSGNKTIAIYAPNGMMKTSFAKAFKDLSKGGVSKDLIFPSRKTIREIKNEHDNDIDGEHVFVIEPYDNNFVSERMSTLLVNQELKNRYDEIHQKIDEEKNEFLKKLRPLSGLRDNNEKEISEAFTGSDDQFFTTILRIKDEVCDENPSEFADITFKEVINDKTVNFLRTKDFKKKIAKYIQKYNDLVESSKYFKKGVFNHNNASVVAKSLTDNGFFEAGHAVTLSTPDGKNEIQAQDQFEKIIEDEKTAILNNPELKDIFDEIDNKIKANKELRDFRDYLLKNPKILVELENLETFKQKLWISYFKSELDTFKSLIDLYQSGKDEIDDIAKKARTEGTQWKKVIDIFNERFFVPFKLEVRNHEDVILKRALPSIAFVFKDSDEESSVEKAVLVEALSGGEKKALYILNVIFEVESRKDDDHKTLLVIDDIADSFDYKNKYAIIEYLKDMSEEEKFHQIILTHNFDFFRTVQSRFVPYKNCLMAEKTKTGAELRTATYIKDPFKNWVNELRDDKKFIASIPFVRNLTEYTKGTNDTTYQRLTALLHIKEGTHEITKKELTNIYNECLPKANLTSTEDSKKVIDLLFELADTCTIATESMNLENKIILSIAIRLQAEKYILSKVSDKSEARGNQTIKFINRYKEEFRNDMNSIDLLERVNLMTPENIHFNSFMYEPILDMSDEHLRKLYKDVRELNI